MVRLRWLELWTPLMCRGHCFHEDGPNGYGSYRKERILQSQNEDGEWEKVTDLPVVVQSTRPEVQH